MENQDMARVFLEIAELLELKGEDHFRVRSYRNAATVVEGLPESLKSMYAHGGEAALTGIHGIGEGTRAKIVEMIETGACALHAGLIEEASPGMLEILKVSGVGPKKAAALHDELGIKDLEGLEKAASTGLIRGLKGFGKVSEEKILRGIRELKARGTVFRRSYAAPVAVSLIEYMNEARGVKNIVPAGSFRRWKETVGDLDLLVACSDPSAVMERFVGYPDVKEVLSKGSTKSSVLLKSGFQVDLRAMEKKSFGAALAYFTGSKAHNVALRERAKKMGLKINEYGVYSEKDGSWLTGEKEEEVYAAVGLPFIPPELREDRGEIEAALAGTLPELLRRKDIKGDLHVHTAESDGANTLAEMAEAAISLGYEYMAVTDHSKAVGIARGLDEKRAMAQMLAIDEFNDKLRRAKKKFTVLKSSEVDIRGDGTLDHSEAVLKKLDIVTASVHSGFNMTEKEMTGRVIKAVRTGFVDIIGHPTGRLIGEREPFLIDMASVMDEAKKHGTAFELNSSPERLDLSDSHCLLAREKGVLVAVSTDSHSAGQFENIEYGVHTAMRGWLGRKDVLNARTLPGLVKILKKRRALR